MQNIKKQDSMEIEFDPQQIRHIVSIVNMMDILGFYSQLESYYFKSLRTSSILLYEG